MMAPTLLQITIQLALLLWNHSVLKNVGNEEFVSRSYLRPFLQL